MELVSSPGYIDVVMIMDLGFHLQLFSKKYSFGAKHSRQLLVEK